MKQAGENILNEVIGNETENLIEQAIDDVLEAVDTTDEELREEADDAADEALGQTEPLEVIYNTIHLRAQSDTVDAAPALEEEEPAEEDAGEVSVVDPLAETEPIGKHEPEAATEPLCQEVPIYTGEPVDDPVAEDTIGEESNTQPPVSSEGASQSEAEQDDAVETGETSQQGKGSIPEVPLDKISGAFSNFRKELKNKYAGPLQPVKIIDKVFKIAQKHARDWGADELRETPNWFDVYVSTYDWNTLYGIEGSDIADKISRKLVEKFRGTNYRLEGIPIITFKEDGELPIGDIRIAPSFGTPKNGYDGDGQPGYAQVPVDIPYVAAETDGNTDKPDEAAGNGVASIPTQPPVGKSEHLDARDLVNGFVDKVSGMAEDFITSNRRSESSVAQGQPRSSSDDKTPPAASPTGDVTPPPPSKSTHRAKLNWKGGSAKISPGSVIGVVRREGFTPDIQLPKSIFTSSVSQDHGAFLCQDGTWYFENHGQYGTTIQLPNSNQRTTLTGNGVKAVICDGACITFADDSLPPLTFKVL